MMKMHPLVIGLLGSGGVEVAQQVQVPTSTEVKDIISVVIQIVIGIATIIGLFKKRKTAS